MAGFEGLIAAPFTPFHPDGSLNTGAIQEQAANLVRDGVRGAFICGTTGEGLSMTTWERRQVAEAWRAAAPPGLAIFVHVGHHSLADAQSLAEHAAALGVDAVAAMPSSPFATNNLDDLTAFISGIASAAPDVPFFYYHIPAFSGVDVSVHDLLQVAGPRVPNLAGVKFTHENLMDFMLSKRLDDGRYDILFGRDEILLAALPLGARSAVGSTYNFAGPLMNGVIEAYRTGDIETARSRQHALQLLLRVVTRVQGLAGQKLAMKLVGPDLGPVRLPAGQLGPVETEALEADLHRIGFVEICQGRVPA